MPVGFGKGIGPPFFDFMTGKRGKIGRKSGGLARSSGKAEPAAKTHSKNGETPWTNP
jgi:hypothetical protein